MNWQDLGLCGDQFLKYEILFNIREKRLGFLAALFAVAASTMPVHAMDSKTDKSPQVIDDLEVQGPILAIKATLERSPAKSADKDQSSIDWNATSGIRTPAWDEIEAVKKQQSMLVRLSGRWRIQNLRLKDNSVAKLEHIHMNQAVVTVTPDGRLFMTAGCSRRSGSIETDDAKLVIEMQNDDPTRCHKSFVALEMQIMARLNQSKSYALTSNTIAFLDQNGLETMVMQRADR